MTYKGMLLSILLVPFVMVGNDVRDERLQQLEEQLFQKKLELSNLGKMIEERGEFLASFGINSKAIARFINQEVKRWEEENDSMSFTEETRNQLKDGIIRKAHEFSVTFFSACDKNINIKDMLINGLFRQNESVGASEFDSLKFYLIRYAFEHELMVALVKRYENCIQDVLAIFAEIENLKTCVWAA